ncbi:hypothetical protein GCM10010123_37190 [Pilimelia anulata]|uniref:SRPBCC domain-containing protein n=1 Tax=Pilimelia anulata TaxID=53371 RepID=A0A8J3BFK4_9ACTN|nr:SRPBCC domain-containing protein [Pilimelia anulata]GGK03810.1 hypothetical protein GCM10010123_37190 [Pilimelia anulata]
MRIIDTSVVVAAPVDVVWRTLLDFGAYPLWNPFIVSISGAAVVGARLTVRIRPPGGRAMTFTPTVRAVEPGRRLSWRGAAPVPGLFAGVHEFVLDADGDRTVVGHRERFTGLLVPLLRGTLDRTARGFVECNEALRARAGTRPAGPAAGV